jgi:hypothetical protein
VPGSAGRTILISARDAGAAKSILPILKHGFTDPSFSCEVVAQGSALQIFGEAGITVRPFVSPSSPSQASDAAGRILEEARRHLEDIKPDAIITGQSAPDVGVDEALVAVSNTPWTFTVQDVAGLITPGFGKLAPYFFVSKPSAASLTLQRADVKPIVVGSLRHANYAELDPCALRNDGRRLLGGGNTNLIGFYGQPAWHLPGYQRTLEQFADSLKALPCGVTLVYRPHPKESASDRAKTHSILNGRGVPFVADPAPSVEMSLCAMDLVVVCYSSCGIDQVYLQRQALSPLNVSLFLMFENDIRANYLTECGVEAPPEIREGLTLGLTDELSSPRTLVDAVTSALAPEAKERAWGTIQRTVAPASDAPAKVISHIEHINWEDT